MSTFGCFEEIEARQKARELTNRIYEVSDPDFRTQMMERRDGRLELRLNGLRGFEQKEMRA